MISREKEPELFEWLQTIPYGKMSRHVKAAIALYIEKYGPVASDEALRESGMNGPRRKTRARKTLNQAAPEQARPPRRKADVPPTQSQVPTEPLEREAPPYVPPPPQQAQPPATPAPAPAVIPPASQASTPPISPPSPPASPSSPSLDGLPTESEDIDDEDLRIMMDLGDKF